MDKIIKVNIKILKNIAYCDEMNIPFTLPGYFNKTFGKTKIWNKYF